MRKGFENFQGHRLTQARMAKGFTKTDLAALVGVTPSSVSNWEKGSLKPELDRVNLISANLEQPIEWFLGGSGESYGSETYFYRSVSSASKKARDHTKIKLDWMAELTHSLSQWVNWPELTLPENKTHFLTLDDEQIEEFAQLTRVASGNPNGPIQNVVLCIENCGAFVSRARTGHKNVDGTSVWCKKNARPFVYLASDKSNGIRSRFDAAHELGHLVLHKHVTATEHQKYHKEIEKQANVFAGAFLLPEKEFVEQVNRITLDTMLAIKLKWKTSVSAMIMRLFQLGIIDEDQKSNLNRNLSYRGWRTEEPFDEKFQFELPRLLPRTVNMVTEHVMPRNELLLTLGYSAQTCETLLSLPEHFFDGVQTETNVVKLRTKHKKQTQPGKPADIVHFNSSNYQRYPK